MTTELELLKENAILTKLNQNMQIEMYDLKQKIATYTVENKDISFRLKSCEDKYLELKEMWSNQKIYIVELQTDLAIAKNKIFLLNARVKTIEETISELIGRVEPN